MKLNDVRRFSAYVSTIYHSEYITGVVPLLWGLCEEKKDPQPFSVCSLCKQLQGICAETCTEISTEMLTVQLFSKDWPWNTSV